MTAKLLVVEYRDVIRAGLEDFLAGTDIQIVAAVSSGKESLRSAQEHKPDVVLLGLPVDESGLQTLQRLKQKLPQLPVVMLVVGDGLTYVARSMARGANGSLSEGCSRGELLAALAAAAAGRDAWTEAQLRRFRGAPPIPPGMQVPLTPRELQVVRQLAVGLPNREIAMMLGISNETVKEHVGSILRKLAVSDRTKAAVWAIRQGLD
jgi:DNA-binding NarL/FixJ family response regulator